MRSVCSLVALLLPACEQASPPADPPPRNGSPEAPGVEVPLLRVVDGDTIRVLFEGRDERVRYVGIDTPEIAHRPGEAAEPLGEEAADANRRLLGAGPLRLVFDVERRDRYGRLLAYVHGGDVMLNEALVRAGYAQTLTIPPNIRHAERFAALQREARAAGRGLWHR